jgi:acetyltransferase-like isoleucine patch superfamily enzyme
VDFRRLLRASYDSFKRDPKKVSPFSLISGTSLHAKCAVKSGCRIYDSSVGRYSFLGRSCFVTNSQVGSFCSIADGCIIGSAAHNLEWASTSPVFQGRANAFRTMLHDGGFEPPKTTKIGDDVWVGLRAIVLGGIHVGNGAVVGAGAIVTKDVPPYAIVAGNPARIIRYRFDDNVISALLESGWWELSDKDLRSVAAFINSPLEFVANVNLIWSSQPRGRRGSDDYAMEVKDK